MEKSDWDKTNPSIQTGGAFISSPPSTGTGAETSSGAAAGTDTITANRPGMGTGSGLGSAGGTPADYQVVDTNAEEEYWRQNYSTRPYVSQGTSFTDYKPAYKYGAEAHRRYAGKSFDEAEPELAGDWDKFKGTSSLTWDKAKHAAREAWQRVRDAMERAMPGDSDRDGR
jgi:hypothetical protein